ncbi:polysaccharide deacetylase family protein [Sporomusa termitida]|uniref:Polysaccharide deacetylase family sporulation protein PdaB n=1 Tax=Sporomusa termitida TaxID=2377 RepID=A0A517DTK8_9FIRM|nr:polysaccharide deacetylase family protein [Sporomusa termitida]QDR80648.1 polysaccharide deacetylase family sporulation protein PdaB [Sporomusa termitida]
MKYKSQLFQALCSLSVVCLILLVASPPALFLFFTNSPVPVAGSPLYLETSSPGSDVAYTLPDIVADACYINENPEFMPVSGKPVYDVFTVEERQSSGLGLEVPAVSPYRAEKVVYLTFDDGPAPETTPVVLDILGRYGIKATFFVVGNQAEKHPAIVRRIYQEGHALGNHSYNHVYRDLYQSANTYIAQLHHTDEIVRSIIGARPRISRAPGGSAGSFTKEYWDILSTQGYVEIGWNISAGDASNAKAGRIVDNIVAQMKNENLWSHAIVLLHDGRGHHETVKALPEIITFYQDRQFEFRVVSFETPAPW